MQGTRDTNKNQPILFLVATSQRVLRKSEILHKLQPRATGERLSPAITPSTLQHAAWLSPSFHTMCIWLRIALLLGLICRLGIVHTLIFIVIHEVIVIELTSHGLLSGSVDVLRIRICIARQSAGKNYGKDEPAQVRLCRPSQRKKSCHRMRKGLPGRVGSRSCVRQRTKGLLTSLVPVASGYMLTTHYILVFYL